MTDTTVFRVEQDDRAIRALPAWRETPFGRMVRYLGERPRPPYPKHERWAVAIGVTEPWEDDAANGTTALHVLSRTTPRHDRVIVPHCSRGLRPCWCWPDEEGFKIDQSTLSPETGATSVDPDRH